MIICAGSIFLDNISRIDQFPKKPIKVLSKGIDKRLGGSAAVSAFTAKILGYNSKFIGKFGDCLLYTSPSPRDRTRSRMPSSA